VVGRFRHLREVLGQELPRPNEHASDPEDLRAATLGLLGAKTAGGKSSDAAITITATPSTMLSTRASSTL